MEAFYNSYSFLNLRLSNTNQRRKEGEGGKVPPAPHLLFYIVQKEKKERERERERESERERVSERESEKDRQTDICKQMI